MEEPMNRKSLMQLANKIIDGEGQVRIATLSDELTISQVVKFFERQGRSFTKTMIQNYIRVGVLPPPLEKRHYTKNHLVLLALIDELKAIYSLEEIKTVLAPIRNNPDIFDDDMIKTTDIYRNYLTMRREALLKWKESLPGLLDRINLTLGEDGVKEGEKDTVAAFMATLTVMAETIAMRDLANLLVKEYIKK